MARGQGWEQQVSWWARVGTLVELGEGKWERPGEADHTFLQGLGSQ